MTIPALPALSRTSPTFRADLDALFLTQLPATIPAFNAEMERINGIGFGSFRANSTSSLSIAVGPQTLAIEAGKGFAVGQTVVMSSVASTGNQMVGQVTAYDGVSGALSVSVSSTAGSGTFAQWVVALTATVQVAAVRTPVNGPPGDGSTTDNVSPTLTGSAFYSLYGVAMSASQWQLATVADFSATVLSTGDVPGTSVTYTIASGVLSVSTTYFWRVRYKDAEGAYSEWSAATSFATAATLNNYIPVPTATPASFGDAFEGGFYAGMVWNELVQSTTSTAIGTGAKAFTVPSMSGAPIVYAGQTLEVRSRANPSNKMIGTVTGALGTALTLNIASVGGSGTFTDWSIMARYRVIFAPKSSGENPGIAYKNANTAAPAAASTLAEGRKATLAMVAADTSTVYPAAHWCNSLTIGSKTDWYLPARDEFELAWRNLKPETLSNRTTDRYASGISYKTFGNVGDVSNANGLNNSSAPVGAAYTAGAPAQTSAAAFQTGGAEAMDLSAVEYWTSSDYSAGSTWSHHVGTFTPGYQTGGTSKNGLLRVRAVRRSII